MVASCLPNVTAHKVYHVARVYHKRRLLENLPVTDPKSNSAITLSCLTMGFPAKGSKSGVKRIS